MEPVLRLLVALYIKWDEISSYQEFAELLDKFKKTQKSTLYTNIVNEIFAKYEEKSCIPQEDIVKANSNLNSEIFVEIMTTIGLDYSFYESCFNLIDEVLLNMRNKIAHGERLAEISLDEIRYNEIHDKVFGLITYFASQISNAAILEDYLVKK